MNRGGRTRCCSSSGETRCRASSSGYQPLPYTCSMTRLQTTGRGITERHAIQVCRSSDLQWLLICSGWTRAAAAGTRIAAGPWHNCIVTCGNSTTVPPAPEVAISTSQLDVVRPRAAVQHELVQQTSGDTAAAACHQSVDSSSRERTLLSCVTTGQQLSWYQTSLSGFMK